MAPTQSITQLVVIVLIVMLGISAVKRFHAEPVRRAGAFGQRLRQKAFLGKVYQCAG
jgi:hypothetical protein